MFFQGVALRETWRRWHVWLGWIAGVPLLLWSMSGLVMASRPLAQIRSEMYLQPVSVAPGQYVGPTLRSADVQSVELVTGPAGPRWQVRLGDGSSEAFDAASGRPAPRLTAAQAAVAAGAAYKARQNVRSVTFVDHDHRTHEQPFKVDSWRVEFADGMRLYIDAWSGKVLVARSAWWTIYDKAWAIHIMDLQGRDDPNNPWIIMLGLLTTVLVVLALGLLPGATRKLLRPTDPAE